MKEIIYVSGHKNPDSDSICAALSYAELKNRQGTGNEYVPIRLGDISRETQFILDHFNVEAPKLIKTVRPQLSDLEIDKVASISPEISVKMAWSKMKEYDVKSLPVTDASGKLLGLASASNLVSNHMDEWDNNILAKSKTKINNILDTLSAKIIYLHNEDAVYPGKLMVAAMQPESAQEHISEGDIVICGDRRDAQLTIIENKCSLMVITGNHSVEDDVITKAKELGTSIIVTPYDTFTASRLIIQSIPINYIMAKDNIVSFRNDSFIEDIKDTMLETRYRSYPVVGEFDKVIGTVSRYHLISQKKKKVILVDHNERTQAVDGIEDAEIVEIVDHHRVANIETRNPIYYRCEPVGSTSTIVANLYFANNIEIPKWVAGLLLGAIISDTLLLKSPTTTDIDKQVLSRLAEIADVDVEHFAKEMFKAGTSLQGKTLDEIFYQDFKSFVINGRKVGVGQVNTMDIEGFEPMKKDMLDLMNKTADNENYSAILLLLTDIYEESSLVLATGIEKDVAAGSLGVTLSNNAGYAPGVVSRKKQVIPPLTSALESLK
ncbi:putative manganese-dependent inorganic diphosphatase [Clostridium cellulovorans]|uniref:inorganic diphosphatase n=1 Tax=Clostridium cellulovorans (strain ATCC 35296 / DSM 3052 / OCM 3 / 743B) TaxID=573061 RepID=D9SKI9_CLOC7|nr:putative manganese-dependent inorganic diphosphatase [Clostridium cellulovorans]ADL51485.1 Inorganic diphosphatase [Clostridium cellulovorans 743B]